MTTTRTTIANDYLKDCEFYLDIYGLYAQNKSSVIEESDYGKLLHILLMAYECVLKAIVAYHIDKNRTYEEIKQAIKAKYRHDTSKLVKAVQQQTNVPSSIKEIIELIAMPELPEQLTLADLRYKTCVAEAIEEDEELFTNIIGNLDWQAECKNKIVKLKNELFKIIHYDARLAQVNLLASIFQEHDKMNGFCSVIPVVR